MFSTLWDTIVIGAGPAGTIASRQLAKQGFRVLLLDKSDFPREKVCGDGLVTDTINCLSRVNLVEDIRLIAHPVKQVSIYSTSRTEHTIAGDYYTLKRYILDEWLLKKSLESGVNFKIAQVNNVINNQNNEVEVFIDNEQNSIKAKSVILATGINTSLANDLKLVNKTKPSAIALRSYVKSDVNLDKMIISYDKSIVPGYGWIFPLKNNEFNIGCGIFLRKHKNPNLNLSKIFNQFINDFPIAKKIVAGAEKMSKPKAAVIRCSLEGLNCAYNKRILAIGETISTTYPLSGEGIGKAMETGELAAEVLGESLKHNNFYILEEYQSRLESEIFPQYKGFKIAEKWISKPKLNSFMINRANKSRFIHKAIESVLNEGKDPRSVFSIKSIVKSFFN